MKVNVTETFEDKTGRQVCEVGNYSYMVEGYDDNSYIVHYNRNRLPEFVREVVCKDNEDACERAWRAAHNKARELNSK